MRIGIGYPFAESNDLISLLRQLYSLSPEALICFFLPPAKTVDRVSANLGSGRVGSVELDSPPH